MAATFPKSPANPLPHAGSALRSAAAPSSSPASSATTAPPRAKTLRPQPWAALALPCSSSRAMRWAAL
eukprot:1938561-Rhodomonas_salina.1